MFYFAQERTPDEMALGNEIHKGKGTNTAIILKKINK